MGPAGVRRAPDPAPSRPQTLPLPDKFSGFAELTLDEWIALGPLITFGLLLLTFIAQGFTSSAPKDSEWCARPWRRLLMPHVWFYGCVAHF